MTAVFFVKAAVIRFRRLFCERAEAISTGDGGVYPVLPLLGKLGYRFGGMEAWLDVGYTLGLGFTLGGTVGFHVGPGVLFAEALYVHGHLDIDDDAKHLFVGMLGYKIGIGNKQKRT